MLLMCMRPRSVSGTMPNMAGTDLGVSTTDQYIVYSRAFVKRLQASRIFCKSAHFCDTACERSVATQHGCFRRVHSPLGGWDCLGTIAGGNGVAHTIPGDGHAVPHACGLVHVVSRCSKNFWRRFLQVKLIFSDLLDSYLLRSEFHSLVGGLGSWCELDTGRCERCRDLSRDLRSIELPKLLVYHEFHRLRIDVHHSTQGENPVFELLPCVCEDNAVDLISIDKRDFFADAADDLVLLDKAEVERLVIGVREASDIEVLGYGRLVSLWVCGCKIGWVDPRRRSCGRFEAL
ncbi:hypothetical protein HBI56_057440 [Parastagonospora nodorum]|nr:hypothetical protein HBH53_150420 [Parastagonospora nodorum]KAH4002946.1 hypothetical protein HBI10_070420 [Parastagonospora nodorum]KAH4027059.1 hypothetical protein HBI09_147620 [Parastagonospora nodorum]KAH4118408.1 hypothetical protein HBH47_142390 [Parastagonospora nodorum]KAH4124853.1 hypothetical protein HBH45_233640 [Parastagonospora nodorum]